MSPFHLAIFVSTLFGENVIAKESIVPAKPHEFPFQVEIKALIHLASGSVLTKVNKEIQGMYFKVNYPYFRDTF